MKANAEVMMGLFSQTTKNYKRWAKFFNLFFYDQYPDYVFDDSKNLLGLGVFVFVHKRQVNNV